MTVLKAHATPAFHRSSWFHSSPTKGCISLRVRHVPSTAPIRFAHEEADYSAYARGSRLHRASGDRPKPSVELGYHLAADNAGGSYLYLYLIMDVWSRRIVGWQIAERESPDVAAALMSRSCAEGNVDPRGLLLHSDNGVAMRGTTMMSTPKWLGVIPSFSRPHVSDDNPYSEALFRTLKHTQPTRVCPSPRWRRETAGSPALLTGITARTATARFVT